MTRSATVCSIALWLSGCLLNISPYENDAGAGGGASGGGAAGGAAGGGAAGGGAAGGGASGGAAGGGAAGGGAAGGGAAGGGAAGGGVPSDGGPDECAPLDAGGVALPSPRRLHAAVLLPGCRVLVASGQIDVLNTRSDSWIYDGRRRGWFDAGSMLEARYGHAAVGFPDGTVWVSGGDSAAGGVLASTEKFDGVAWSNGPVLSSARLLHTAARTSDGGLLVVGGLLADGGATASIERCCSPDGGWFSAGALTSPRARHSMTELHDGGLLIVGGNALPLGGGMQLASAELYDPTTRRVTDAGHLAVGRSAHAALLFETGVMVLGGFIESGDGGIVSTDTVEWFDLATSTWRCLPRMGAPRARFAAVLIDPTTVLIVGGIDDVLGSALNTSELYPLAVAGSCSPAPLPVGRSAGIMNATRSRLTVTRLPNGSVLAVGGQPGSQLYVPDAGWQPGP